MLLPVISWSTYSGRGVLTYCGLAIPYGIDDTKPLPEPILTNYKYDP